MRTAKTLIRLIRLCSEESDQTDQTLLILTFTRAVSSPVYSRVGNLIIGASGSDKQMLYGSSVARAAQTTSAVNKI